MSNYVTIPTYSSEVIKMPYEYNPLYIYKLSIKNPELINLLKLNFKNRKDKYKEIMEELIFDLNINENDIDLKNIDDLFNNSEEMNIKVLEERVVKTNRRLDRKMSPQNYSNNNEEENKNKNKNKADYSQSLKLKPN